MSAEITVGSVLGGRYLVTAEVVASAEGDFVFEGTDQVLNRPVSLLVAAPANATRVAVSAREIAMGTRPSEVQVLDLGLNADSTYLIANLVDAASLLDLVVEPDAPYIEPFQTDTLGQEIFGMPRSLEPQVYEDDAEYYEELAQEQQRRPLFDRLFGKKGDVGEPTTQNPIVGAAAAAESYQPGHYASVEGAGAAEPLTGPFAAAPQSAADAAAARREAVQPAVTELPSLPDDATQPGDVVPPASPAAPAAAEPSSDTDAARAAAARGQDAREASRFPREALGAPAAAASAAPQQATALADDLYDEEDEPRQPREDNDTQRWTRLLVGVLLVAVLVAGVVFAVQALGRGGDKPTASPSNSAPGTTSKPTSTSGAPSTTAVPVVKPVVAGIDIAAPGADRVSSLYVAGKTAPENAVDGDTKTSFVTYSYRTPAFGGFFPKYTLRLELEGSAKVSLVTLQGLVATGGEMQVAVGKTEDPDKAKEVFSGSFSGATLEAPTLSNGEPTEGKYVFVTISEQPRLISPYNPDNPYGFQVSEIQVS